MHLSRMLFWREGANCRVYCVVVPYPVVKLGVHHLIGEPHTHDNVHPLEIRRGDVCMYPTVGICELRSAGEALFAAGAHMILSGL